MKPKTIMINKKLQSRNKILLSIGCNLFPGETIWTPSQFISQSDDKKIEYSEWYVGQPKTIHSVAIDKNGDWFVYLHGLCHFGSPIIDGPYPLNNFKICAKTKTDCERLVKKLNELQRDKNK
jgi:hypothetical protein